MTVIKAAVALHQAYEKRQQRRNPFYTPRRWEQLDDASQVEHLGIAEAVAHGRTQYLDKRIPTWVRDVIKEHL